MREHVIGIDVGGTKIAYGLYGRHKKLIEKCRHAADSTLSAEAFFDRMLDEIGALLSRNGLSGDDLRGVGVGMPSFVLHAEGRIVTTVNLKRIENFEARAYLQQRLGADIRVEIDNDAHAAALAEHRYGAGRGFPHMLYCPISTGMASGIIINGELFRGSYGWSGESGHMVATPGAGELCGCGNRGCFVSYCSGAMIIRHIQRWIAEGQATAMTSYPGPGEKLTAEHLLRACRAGDALALRALDQMGHYLGLWCFNLYVTLNINCFVFGGGLTNFGESLFGRMRSVFDSFNHNAYPVHFKLAELGDECGVLGAMELVSPELAEPDR
jgi:glucokinase